MPPQAQSSENPIVLHVNKRDPLAYTDGGGCHFSVPLSYLAGAVCSQDDAMNNLFDILKKDRKGTFHWVEAVRDFDAAEARVRQLCAESQDEFVVFRNIDLRVVAVGAEDTYRWL
jgi:hypothetical protein